MRRHTTLSLLRATLAAGVLFVAPEPAQATDIRVGDKNIIIQLDRLRIRDEDDAFSNDEPYLIAAKFRLRVRLNPDLTLSVVVPATVTRVMSGRATIRACCNWADEPNSYALPRAAINEFVPAEDGWVVGAVIVHMENDGFDTRLAATVSARTHEAIQAALTSPTLAVPDTRGIPSLLHARILHKIVFGIEHQSLAHLASGVAAAADPDDFGGVGLVLGVTSGGRVMMFEGPLDGDPVAAVARARAVEGTTAFSIGFPTRSVQRAKTPDVAKFKGSHILEGRFTAGTFTRLD